MCCLVEQIVVEDSHSSHGFNDRYGTWQDAWVVAATGVENGRITVLIDGLDFFEKRRNWLEGTAEVDRLAVADAALDAARVVASSEE